MSLDIHNNPRLKLKKLDCGLTEISMQIDGKIVKMSVEEDTGKIISCNPDDPCIFIEGGKDAVWTDKDGNLVKTMSESGEIKHYKDK